VVGVGAPPGGPEALEKFFSRAPADSGLSFVVVRQLHLHDENMLVEALQRVTRLPVSRVVEGQKPLPNHIHIIPTGKDLALMHGVLRLTELSTQCGERLPIDHFLRSLAVDLRGEAVGVLLSGTCPDGTLGLRAVKENAGAVFVQAPASANFETVRRSAVQPGLVDVAAPAEELVPRILAFLRDVAVLLPVESEQALVDASADVGDIDQIVLLLREHTGHDFSLYRKSTLVRRIERRLVLHRLASIGDYVRLLRESTAEAELLFQELLIGVTNFFREPAVWEKIKEEVLPALLSMRPNGGVLRVWVPGCSTGEEAYSLAMVFKEAIELAPLHASLTLQIFATDLDKTAIDQARHGIYPLGIAADVSEQRLRRFFVAEGHRYRISTDIREMVVFAQHNVAADPPFTRLDLLSCRNLLIYLEPELQEKIIALFHYSLKPGGVLLLGSAETVGQASELFAPWPGKERLFRRLDGSTPDQLGILTAVFEHRQSSQSRFTSTTFSRAVAATKMPNLKQLAGDLLLERFTPAAVLVTAKGDIAYVSGRTGRFLEPAAGKANLNLIAMAREGLNHALAENLHRAFRDKHLLTLNGVEIVSNGGTLQLNVHLHPLDTANALPDLALVVFEEIPPTAHLPPVTDGSAAHTAQARRLTALQSELRRAHEELQFTREEMQASQEELKSANEELKSTNEELQSTNEELTTSKEEMQLINEELQTVNSELLDRVDELVHTSDDMSNLINSTQVATLFLDAGLGVRRFTPATARLIRVIPSDLGRPVTDLVSTLDYPELADDAREVLRTLVASVRDVPGSDGCWYAAHVMPYRTQDNRIDGVVVTFSDIAMAKALEGTLHAAQLLLAGHAADQSREPDALRGLDALLRHAHELLDKRFADQRRAFVQDGVWLRAGVAKTDPP
jgi:two-component system CheB/CheR fusion protein